MLRFWTLFVRRSSPATSEAIWEQRRWVTGLQSKLDFDATSSLFNNVIRAKSKRPWPGEADSRTISSIVSALGVPLIPHRLHPSIRGQPGDVLPIHLE